ncbi:carbohydrate ABC transporter permease [Kineothrix sp. MB12-C1]|uniref:carbohydrate ABC transporter permease n=1 Tax=Kineothrix sp. MB12-C1 TaxID=3070215 RepID=UPI0027D263D4|nr:carbohydrate ABC transporter permease [Kineothrix sp. MB12-C1]WMC91863.1 carbohydrate ABC transporter permease [Kineothrix sp. MB12-C1]
MSFVGKIGSYFVLVLWGVPTVYPLFWIVMNSFKDKRTIHSDSFSLPIGESFTLENYITAFQRINLLGAYRNSLIISTTVAVAVILLASLAAYVLVRYDFRLKGFLNNMIIAGMMFPAFATILPVLRMMNVMGLTNTDQLSKSLLAVILPQIAGNLSFAIVILKGYIGTLPLELEEAAYMEGSNIFQLFFQVIMPLSKPSLATVGIFSFVWSYNDLFTQSFFLKRKPEYSVTVLLSLLTSQEGTNYGLMASSVSLIIMPLLITYLLLQKYIIKGMTVGALKG